MDLWQQIRSVWTKSCSTADLHGIATNVCLVELRFDLQSFLIARYCDCPHTNRFRMCICGHNWFWCTLMNSISQSVSQIGSDHSLLDSVGWSNYLIKLRFLMIIVNDNDETMIGFGHNRTSCFCDHLEKKNNQKCWGATNKNWTPIKAHLTKQWWNWQ